jgi:hypothetical protein
MRIVAERRADGAYVAAGVELVEPGGSAGRRVGDAEPGGTARRQAGPAYGDALALGAGRYPYPRLSSPKDDVLRWATALISSLRAIGLLPVSVPIS